MLRKRIITALTFNNGVLYRTHGFAPDYRYTANFVDAWSVDEIVMLDVTRPGQGDRHNFENAVRAMVEDCFVPLAVGGGVRTLDDCQRLLQLGADKIVLNTGAIDDPTLVEKTARRYGSQCVVVGIDASRRGQGYEVQADFGSRPTGLAPDAWASQAARLGAGEILLQSVERDGSLEGYELPLCRLVRQAVDVPMVVCCGAGNWSHFAQAFAEAGADGVCTQNIFHFTEASILAAKRFLHAKSILVRL